MRTTILAFLCLLVSMNAKSETISESQAVQLVKQTRNVDGKDTANYYIGTVSSVIDEYYCRPSSDISYCEFSADESKENS